jgi:hypothetical protein
MVRSRNFALAEFLRVSFIVCGGEQNIIKWQRKEFQNSAIRDPNLNLRPASSGRKPKFLE